MNSQSTIYCIGDSHVNFFSGKDYQSFWPVPSISKYPFFKSFHLGPITAYNLPKKNASTQGKQKIFYILKQHIPAHSTIMLSCGEIDCRAHLVKQAHKQQISFTNITKECTQRYFQVVKQIQQLGFRVIIWNILPTYPHDTYGNQAILYPHSGTAKQRQHITELFNQHLERLCKQHNCIYLSIYDQLVDTNGKRKEKYFWDHAHLNQQAMPILMCTIEQLFPNINFTQKQYLISAKVTYCKEWWLYLKVTGLLLALRQLIQFLKNKITQSAIRWYYIVMNSRFIKPVVSKIYHGRQTSTI